MNTTALEAIAFRQRALGVGHAVPSVTFQAGGMKKAIINLMNPVHRLQQAPRCSATAKRTRKPCRAPAVRGWTVCRCHGARGGAPPGERNGRYRHGGRTKAALAEHRALSKLIRKARASIARLV